MLNELDRKGLSMSVDAKGIDIPRFLVDMLYYLHH